MQMSEIEREEIITQRLEEKQRLLDKRKISQMVKKQRSGESESVSKAAKRQSHSIYHLVCLTPFMPNRTTRNSWGNEREITKARRTQGKAQGKGRETTCMCHPLSVWNVHENIQTKGSPRRDRSSSPVDMEISDEESEDGQISKLEQEEEKDRKLFSKGTVVDDQPVTVEDLNKVRLSRDMLAKYCMAPWFQDYVQGTTPYSQVSIDAEPECLDAWVRYLIGQENGAPVYRICEVSSGLLSFMLFLFLIDWKTLVPIWSSHIE